jgi:predicted nucleic acid-binding Zn ribbon protein
LIPIVNMPDAKGKYDCKECGTSFAIHEALVNHNVSTHGAAIGAQLRQSEEIEKQRERE